MNSNLAKVLMVVVVLGLLTGCGTMVKPGQMGIKYKALHTPALQEDVRAEGFYWQLPWNSIVAYDVTWQSKSEDVEILTADNLHIRTKVTATFRPDRARLYELATQIGREYYNQVIRPPFVTLARSEFAKHAHNKLAEESPLLENSILAKLREAVSGKPLEVDRVSIDHIQYDPSVTKAISNKIATEQLAEQKLVEVKVAEQNAEIARTQARGQADALQIIAGGEARAIVLKGEAQATAQSAITKTLTPSYLRYKAFDSNSTRYYFVPVGKDGMPIIVNTEATKSE